MNSRTTFTASEVEAFKPAEKALGAGVVPAVTFAGHALPYPKPINQISEILVGIIPQGHRLIHLHRVYYIEIRS